VSGIYLDQDTNNVLVSGNIIGPPETGASNANSYGGGAAVIVNSGNHDVVTGNIIDLGSAPYTFAEIIAGSDPANASSGGDVFSGNIVLSRFTGNSLATFTGVSGTAFMQGVDGQFNSSEFTIANNVYHNYAGGQELSNGNVASDSSPNHFDPQISGPLYTIAAGSPVFGGGINFTPIVGGWGPPGFVIPQG
jgi:hypothetical protein